MTTGRFVHGRKIIDSLIENGIADDTTQRVIIDIPLDGMPIIYTQKIGTDKLFNIIPVIRDGGYEIVREEGKTDD